MMLCDVALQDVLNGEMSYCKFLSANDTGATGGHQSGILVSKSALNIMFDDGVLNEHISKREVNIMWQNDFDTRSCFTWYSSKNELRITRLGRNFPYLIQNCWNGHARSITFSGHLKTEGTEKLSDAVLLQQKNLYVLQMKF